MGQKGRRPEWRRNIETRNYRKGSGNSRGSIRLYGTERKDIGGETKHRDEKLWDRKEK